MNNPFMLHLLVALVWLFLSGNTTLGNFFVALTATFALLALFQKPLGCQSYVRRVKGFATFLVRFAWDVMLSNIRLMRIALRRDAGSIRGHFIHYDVAGLTDFEVLLIAQCIGLSPGTMAADRTADGRHLAVHVFGLDEPEAVSRKLDAGLKNRILAFTR